MARLLAQAVGVTLISPDCVFDASLVPATCLGRFRDMKGPINKFLESRVTVQVVLPQFHSGKRSSGTGAFRVCSD